MQAAGFFVNTNPKQFQIFHNGVEQSILVAGESDGVFDPVDYIEFYGEKNDGWLDAQLYEDPVNHIDPYYSLFCDTAAYFLTVEIALYSMITYLSASRTLDFVIEGIEEYIGVTIV